jgi:hypothetical protein
MHSNTNLLLVCLGVRIGLQALHTNTVFTTKNSYTDMVLTANTTYMGQGRSQHGKHSAAPAVLAREGGSERGREGGREGGRQPRVTLASRDLQHRCCKKRGENGADLGCARTGTQA